jgi:hypothetical protein
MPIMPKDATAEDTQPAVLAAERAFRRAVARARRVLDDVEHDDIDASVGALAQAAGEVEAARAVWHALRRL